MQLRALTWNLFHGRDHPPNPGLLTWRSRLLRASERDDSHLQVNRNLLDEFAATIAGDDWDVALLQECPPRWQSELEAAARAEGHRALTSRNAFGAARAAIARRNPDLIASNEGGSNLTLVRGEILAREQLVLAPGPRPERRVMALTHCVPHAFASPLWVANLHASAGRARRADAERELLRAAAHAIERSDGEPVLLGGDLNLRPAETEVYGELERRFGLAAPTSPRSLDHLLVRGLSVVEAPSAWPDARREVAEGGLSIRLSDHAPVEATFGPAAQEGVPAPARK